MSYSFGAVCIRHSNLWVDLIDSYYLVDGYTVLITRGQCNSVHQSQARILIVIRHGYMYVAAYVSVSVQIRKDMNV